MADELNRERPLSCPVSLSDRKLSAEKLPLSQQTYNNLDVGGDEDEIADDVLEEILTQRAKDGDNLAKFQLGQFFFERQIYDKALVAFERIKSWDVQAKYQMGVMFYDGLGTTADPEKGFKYLHEVATSPEASHIVHCAEYNIARAYFEGFGVKQSDVEAETWLLRAAHDGNPNGSVKAQSVLGLFYSRPGTDMFNLEKAYFWHQEATGNGSLESQGALGVMFEHGVGVSRDIQAAFKCLKDAAIRGNVYAQGNLALQYYNRKLFNKAADVAKSVGEQDDIEGLAEETDCLAAYVAKGIALGAFVYARCLHHGLGVEKDETEARNWYCKAASFDLDIVARMQDQMTQGYI